MKLGFAAMYEALRTRDERFDGKFFVGVETTGIYCRPICPARTPLPGNCRFYAHAAQAEEAGHRPCLRCRPERAPGNATTDAVPAMARRVVERIEDGALDEGGLEALAAELGVTSRHLRRVVRQSLGVTPIALVQTQRLLLAKRLLTETRLRVIDVAHAAGFESLRRFNHLVKSRYRLTPTQIRRSCLGPVEDHIESSLCYAPPLDWGALAAFLGHRAVAGVEHVDGSGNLRRSLRVGGREGWIQVSHDGVRGRVNVRVASSLAAVLPAVLARVKRLCDLTASPRAIAQRLGPLARGREGLRIPGAADPFELAVRAILGQQVSVRAATTLATRLAGEFGEPIGTPFPEVGLLFPTPGRIAAARESDFARLGIVRTRARAVLALAKAVEEGTLQLEHASDWARVPEQLRAIPGVGDWTAQYIAMRGLGWPDAFPAGDLMVRRALGGVSARRAEELSEGWRPWRSYAVMHLWKSQEDSP